MNQNDGGASDELEEQTAHHGHANYDSNIPYIASEDVMDEGEYDLLGLRTSGYARGSARHGSSSTGRRSRDGSGRHPSQASRASGSGSWRPSANQFGESHSSSRQAQQRQHREQVYDFSRAPAEPCIVPAAEIGMVAGAAGGPVAPMVQGPVMQPYLAAPPAADVMAQFHQFNQLQLPQNYVVMLHEGQPVLVNIAGLPPAAMIVCANALAMAAATTGFIQAGPLFPPQAAQPQQLHAHAGAQHQHLPGAMLSAAPTPLLYPYGTASAMVSPPAHGTPPAAHHPQHQQQQHDHHHLEQHHQLQQQQQQHQHQQQSGVALEGGAGSLQHAAPASSRPPTTAAPPLQALPPASLAVVALPPLPSPSLDIDDQDGGGDEDAGEGGDEHQAAASWDEDATESVAEAADLAEKKKELEAVLRMAKMEATVHDYKKLEELLEVDTESERLGEGGFSRVRPARIREGNEPVALKVLDSSKIIDKIAFVWEFIILGRVTHESIVQLRLGLFVSADRTKFAMVLERAAGDVTGVLEGKVEVIRIKSVAVFTRIFVSIGKALEHLHEMNYLHRDVKPQNLLVRFDGTVVLADFGLARKVETWQNASTVVGTVYYWPLEVRAGTEYNHLADVFSLGMSLWELITKRDVKHLAKFLDKAREKRSAAKASAAILDKLRKDLEKGVKEWEDTAEEKELFVERAANLIAACVAPQEKRPTMSMVLRATALLEPMVSPTLEFTKTNYEVFTAVAVVASKAKELYKDKIMNLLEAVDGMGRLDGFKIDHKVRDAVRIYTRPLKELDAEWANEPAVLTPVKRIILAISEMVV